jgi:hypothetical protein
MGAPIVFLAAVTGNPIKAPADGAITDYPRWATFRKGTALSAQLLVCMILTLTIAWLALQLPFATLVGKCIKLGMGEPGPLAWG